MFLVNKVNKNQAVSLIALLAMFFLYEMLLPLTLKYFSIYGDANSSHFSIFFLPLIFLLLVPFESWLKPFFYFIIFHVLMVYFHGVLALNFLVLTLVIFFSTRANINSRILTLSLLLILFTLGAIGSYSIYLYSPHKWFWILLQCVFLLKSLSWIVTVRLYKKNYSISQFFNFFFNPVFYFFTNDLNVLTPISFFRSIENSTNTISFAKIFKLALSGLFLMLVYGFLQNFYFIKSNQDALIYSPLIGGAISIITAIVFHSANVFIQISLMQVQGYDIDHDMNSPWLTTSPSDYWKRMHYFVRDYIHEIIAKPLMLLVYRKHYEFLGHKLILALAIYALFISTQIGYQPFRTNRSLEVGFLVTAIFVAMMFVSEYLLKSRFINAFSQIKWLGRLFTFLILYIGYSFIFYMRRGF